MSKEVTATLADIVGLPPGSLNTLQQTASSHNLPASGTTTLTIKPINNLSLSSISVQNKPGIYFFKLITIIYF